MTVGEIRAVTQLSNKAIIKKNGKVIFIGWVHDIPQEIQSEKVERLNARPEIRHRKWKELGLESPLKPSDMLDYKFKDLELRLYYEIKI